MNGETRMLPALQLERYYRRFLWTLLLDEAARALLWAAAAVIVLVLPGWFAPGEWLRWILLLALFAALAAIIAAAALQVRRLASTDALCRALESRSPVFSDLWSAQQLSAADLSPGISPELTRRLIETVQSRLDDTRPEQWLRPDRARRLLPSLAAIALVAATLFIYPTRIGVVAWNRLVAGQAEELARKVRVSPQGGRVLWGEPARIEAELLEDAGPAPRLAVFNQGQWEEAHGSAAGAKTVFEIPAVTQEVRYRVRWRGLESPAYRLIPVEPPQLSDLRFELTYPEYTGMQPETIEGVPQVLALRGTRVRMTARSTKPLQKIELGTSNGIAFPVALDDGRGVRADFSVLNPFEFWFELSDKDGVRPKQPARYSVLVRDDRYPEVRLLAPIEDLRVGRETRLPFTFEIKDDIGASALFLRILRDDGSVRQRTLLKRYAPAALEKIDTVEYSLAPLKTASGEVLKLQLEVQDNDTVTGPKSGFSQTLLIEIQSYEKEHKQIEDSLKEFRKELLDLLAKQTLSRKDDAEWKGMNPQQLAAETQAAAQKQAELSARAEQMEKNLDGILERMERDPLTDYALLGEHRAIRDSMQSLRQGAMQTAQQNFQQQNWQQGTSDQDSAISELERLADLSEELHKHNKMQDLVHQSERVQERGEQLEERLAAAQTLDAQMMRELQDTLREAMEILAEMQKQIRDLPKDLPEDFVNQESVKKLDFNQMANAANQLNQALQRGDAQAALQAARSFLKQMREARSAISKAAEQSPLSSEKDLASQVAEKQGALQKMIDRQENLLKRTTALESKRQQASLAQQRKTLAELAARQRQAIAEAEALSAWLAQRGAEPAAGIARNDLQMTLPKMQKVLQELDQANVIFSQKWLEEILGSLSAIAGESAAQAALHRSTVPAIAAAGEQWRPVADRMAALRQTEQEIADKLKSPPRTGSEAFSDADRNELQKLKDEQKQLSEETRRAANEVMKLSQQSAHLKPDIAQSLKEAGQSMNQARDALGNQDTEIAQAQEQRALAQLRKGQEGMQSAQDQMAQSKKMGGQTPGFIQPRGGGQASGPMGSRTGAVRIPRADEYLPPRQFREEVLESLKERYPKAQEEVIKQYYKKITQ